MTDKEKALEYFSLYEQLYEGAADILDPGWKRRIEDKLPDRLLCVGFDQYTRKQFSVCWRDNDTDIGFCEVFGDSVVETLGHLSEALKDAP